jgi:hypothetical protein
LNKIIIVVASCSLLAKDSQSVDSFIFLLEKYRLVGITIRNIYIIDDEMRVTIQRASQTGENKHNWKKNNHSQKERGSEKCV